MNDLVKYIPVSASGSSIARVFVEYLSDDECVLFHAIRSNKLATLKRGTVFRFPAIGSLLNDLAFLVSIEPSVIGHRITNVTVIKSSVGMVVDAA
jgi:hypothetical protein